MNMAAFVSLEDISDALPSYNEEVISVEMDPLLKKAYSDLEDDDSKRPLLDNTPETLP